MPADPEAPEVRAEIENFLQSDAEELVEARKKAKAIHRTKDIRAAGNEVERAVRDLLDKRLPNAFKVLHGHVVDRELRTSPQLDVIIADAATTAPLAIARDGTTYVPYESVYSIGEVKTTYARSEGQIEEFSRTITTVRDELVREKASPGLLPGGKVSLGQGFQTGEKRPHKNPLFTFIIFVGAPGFDVSHVKELYDKTPCVDLPTVACFLDQGVIAPANIRMTNPDRQELGPLSVSPEFEGAQQAGEALRWVFIPFGREGMREGANYGALYFLLMSHLNSCVLTTPPMEKYIGQGLVYQSAQAFADVKPA